MREQIECHSNMGRILALFFHYKMHRLRINAPTRKSVTNLEVYVLVKHFNILFVCYVRIQKPRWDATLISGNPLLIVYRWRYSAESLRTICRHTEKRLPPACRQNNSAAATPLVICWVISTRNHDRSGAMGADNLRPSPNYLHNTHMANVKGGRISRFGSMSSRRLEWVWRPFLAKLAAFPYGAEERR